MNLDIAGLSVVRSWGKNSEIWQESSVLTLRLKRSSTVSSKVLKTLYWLDRCIFIDMFRWLDLKNILIWLGFSHFCAAPSFFLSFFLYFLPMPTSRTSSGNACARHVAWNLHYARAHWSFQNSGRCTCTPRGMLVEVRFPRRDLPTEEEKKQPKKISKRKSRSWLLVKNSKRHNFTDTEWNHALQRGICSLKSK